MRGVPAVVALAVLLAGCSDGGSPAAGPDGAGGPAAVGTLSGVVVDDAIRPVAGAAVLLDGTVNATTGADGTFAFAAVTPGAHVVRATKNGFADSVTQVIVAASEPTPLLKLVLVVDASNLAYASVQKIEGFIECGTDTANRYFAACGGPNTASFIVCAQVAMCMGNVTGDRYIVIQWFDATPTFLVTETAWTATSELGRSLAVWLGSATKEQLQFYPETPSVWNNSAEGPSPLYSTMDSEMLNESGIGRDSWFLGQVFAGDSGMAPTGIGVVVQQRFQMFFTSFYGYQPPADWRFSATGAPPPPPA